MADIGTVMFFKGAVIGVGASIALAYRSWSVSFVEKNRRTRCPPDVSPVAYYIGKRARALALAAKRRLLKRPVNPRDITD